MSKWTVKTPKQLLTDLVNTAYERWHLHTITSRNPFNITPSGKIGELTTNLDEKDTKLLNDLTSDETADVRWSPNSTYYINRK